MSTLRFSRLLVGGGGAAAAVSAYFWLCNKGRHHPPLDKDEFRSFKLISSVPATHNSKILRFSLDSPNATLSLPVCSAVLLRHPDNEKVMRPYTPISLPSAKGYFELVVKEYAGGKMSSFLSKMAPGDSVLVRGPLLKLPYERNMRRHIGMIAGGTGITPMLQLIRKIISDPQDKTMVTLLFGNVSENDILLKDELDKIAKDHPNFDVHYTVDRLADPKSGYSGDVGLVTAGLIKKYLPRPSDDSMILVCGPPQMVAAVAGNKGESFTQGDLAGILQVLGYTKEQVYKF